MSGIEGTNIEYAHSLLDDLRLRYLADFPEQIDDFEELVLALEGEGPPQEALETLYRSLHSMKGTSGTFGLHVISKICHHAEELLVLSNGNTQSITRDYIDSFLDYIDLMRKAHRNIVEGNSNNATIDKQLYALKKRHATASYSGLIVESSRTYASLYIKLLSALPIQFAIVDNGLHALERLLDDRFDLLISGMEVPGLNGLALISALRLCECPNEHIKTILVTSSKVRDLPAIIAPDGIIQKDKSMTENLLQVVQEFALTPVQSAD